MGLLSRTIGTEKDSSKTIHAYIIRVSLAETAAPAPRTGDVFAKRPAR